MTKYVKRNQFREKSIYHTDDECPVLNRNDRETREATENEIDAHDMRPCKTCLGDDFPPFSYEAIISKRRHRSEVYHTDPECRGVRSLKREERMSIEQAEELGYTECEYCAEERETKREQEPSLRDMISTGEVEDIHGGKAVCPGCDNKPGKCTRQKRFFYTCENSECKFYLGKLARTKDQLRKVYAELAGESEVTILADD